MMSEFDDDEFKDTESDIALIVQNNFSKERAVNSEERNSNLRVCLSLLQQEIAQIFQKQVEFRQKIDNLENQCNIETEERSKLVIQIEQMDIQRKEATHHLISKYIAKMEEIQSEEKKKHLEYQRVRSNVEKRINTLQKNLNSVIKSLDANNSNKTRHYRFYWGTMILMIAISYLISSFANQKIKNLFMFWKRRFFVLIFNLSKFRYSLVQSLAFK